jgi:predicted RecA/RadA family phage recombinase
MAKNQKYTNALHIKLTAPYDVASGDPVRIGSVCGIAQTTAAAGEKVTVWLDGSHVINVTGATAEGDPVYITPTGAVNRTATGNYLFGVALEAKAATTNGPVEVAPIGYTTQTAAGV